MAAFDPATLDRWRALAIVDRDGVTVGTISEFYLDRETGYPTWALVNTGLFGANQTFVPLVHATEISDGLQVPYEKGRIKDTPRVDLHDELTPQEEATLFAHYGVDYQPSPEAPATADAEGGSDRASGAADAEFPAEPGPAGSAGPAPGPGPGPVPAEPGSVGAPGAVDREPGPVPPEPAFAGSPGPVEPGPVTGEPPGPVPAEPGSIDAGQGSAPPDSTQVVPAEPGADEAPGAAYGPGPAGGRVADTPRPTGPHGATRLDPDDFSSEEHEQGQPGSAAERGEGPADAGLHRFQAEQADPALSRPAPVEPGLPGSTAASPYGPAPTTIDKDAGPAAYRAEESFQSPGGSGRAPGAATGFEEQDPADRPAGASDRWREAKLAAERDRIARAAAAQPEERSPLERARRRLERLVGVGQDPDDEDGSPVDRDAAEAAERARRARLGLDNDDRLR